MRGSRESKKAAGDRLNGSEKRRIYEQVKTYRKENGLGCFSTLEKASKGKVTADDLRGMMDGGLYPDRVWRETAKALKKVRAAGK